MDELRTSRFTFLKEADPATQSALNRSVVSARATLSLSKKLLAPGCLSLILMGIALPAMALGKDWTIDSSASNIAFNAHRIAPQMGPLVCAKGTFTGISGKIVFDGKDLTQASVAATIPVTTILTGIPKRDQDLKSAQYLDTARFPTASFKSKKIRKDKSGKYIMTGEFQLHGVSKVIDVTLNELPKQEQKNGATSITAVGKTMIYEKDYGLNIKILKPVVVVDDIEITVTIKANADQGKPGK